MCSLCAATVPCRDSDSDCDFLLVAALDDAEASVREALAVLLLVCQGCKQGAFVQLAAACSLRSVMSGMGRSLAA